MNSPLHSGLAGRVEELAREFASAQPFPHVVIEPFLDPAFCDQLISEFPLFDTEKARNEMGEVAGKAVVSNLAAVGPAYGLFDRLMQDPEFLALTGRITGIPDLLYDPEYVGGGGHMRTGQARSSTRTLTSTIIRARKRTGA